MITLLCFNAYIEIGFIYRGYYTKFIKSKFKVLWGTVFSFFYGFFATDVIAQDNDDSSDAAEESAKEADNLDPGAIAAAAAAAAALLAASDDGDGA